MTSKYLDAEGNKKTPYKYPAWAAADRFGGYTPARIERELDVARANPQAWKEARRRDLCTERNPGG